MELKGNEYFNNIHKAGLMRELERIVVREIRNSV